MTADPITTAREAAAFALCRASGCVHPACRKFADCGEQAEVGGWADAAVIAFLRGLPSSLHLENKDGHILRFGRRAAALVANAIERKIRPAPPGSEAQPPGSDPHSR